MSNKVLVVASGGGHWIEMRRRQPTFDGLDVAFVSFHSAYAEEVPGHRFYVVLNATRWDRIGLAVLVAQLTFILMRERPHVVVTPGAAHGMVAVALAKFLLRSRTMWIDSPARSERLSLPAKLEASGEGRGALARGDMPETDHAASVAAVAFEFIARQSGWEARDNQDGEGRQ